MGGGGNTSQAVIVSGTTIGNGVKSPISSSSGTRALPIPTYRKKINLHFLTLFLNFKKHKNCQLVSYEEVKYNYSLTIQNV